MRSTRFLTVSGAVIASIILKTVRQRKDGTLIDISRPFRRLEVPRRKSSTLRGFPPSLGKSDDVVGDN
jgi:hypothetical protein